MERGKEQERKAFLKPGKGTGKECFPFAAQGKGKESFPENFGSEHYCPELSLFLEF